jgi:radical SAM protein with 4Fe4S-binding SPASM domain
MKRYSPFKYLWNIFKKRPIHLTLFLTNRCNAYCPFCFYAEKGNPDTKELSIEEISKISSSLGDLLWLAFSGGEIFLRGDIVEITEIFYKKNHPSIILLPTNGIMTDVIYRKTEEILKNCPKSTIVIKLSVEGNESIHDSLRGKGNFKKVMETYDKLSPLLKKYKNFELGINTVFCRANQYHMEEIIDLVLDLKHIRTHTISLIRGRVPDESLKEVDIFQYLKTIDILAENLRRGKGAIYRFRGARFKAAQDILQRQFIYRTLKEKRQVIPCLAGRLNLVITEDGDVYPCETFSLKLGNLREYNHDLNSLIHSVEARAILESISAGECYCTHECYMMTNILFNPATYPRLLFEYIRLFLHTKSVNAFNRKEICN